MASFEDAESLIRAARDQRRLDEDEAHRLRQQYLREEAAARKKEVAVRTRLLELARYAGPQLSRVMSPDTRLELERVVRRQKRGLWSPRFVTVYDTVAEGWSVGYTSSEEEHITLPACDPYTGEEPKGYKYRSPDTLLTGRILATNGDLVNFCKVRRSSGSRKPAEMTLYTGREDQFSTIQTLDVEPEQIDPEDSSTDGRQAPETEWDYPSFACQPTTPDSFIEPAIVELVVKYVPES